MSRSDRASAWVVFRRALVRDEEPAVRALEAGMTRGLRHQQLRLEMLVAVGALHVEHFVLMRGRRAVAELRPVPAGMRLGDLPELLASLPRLGSEDAAAFEDDLATARDQLRRLPENDVWES